MNNDWDHLDIPDLPEFCTPYQGTNTAAWLLPIFNKVSTLFTKNSKEYQRVIDSEVAAALFIAMQITANSELQKAWCQQPEWVGKNKSPKNGDTSNIVQEVFRYIWVLRGNDQDGYELRYNAVRHFMDQGVASELITTSIREEGGYVAIRNKIRSSKAERRALDEPAAGVEKRPNRVETQNPPKMPLPDDARVSGLSEPMDCDDFDHSNVDEDEVRTTKTGGDQTKFSVPLKETELFKFGQPALNQGEDLVIKLPDKIGEVLDAPDGSIVYICAYVRGELNKWRDLDVFAFSVVRYKK